MAAGLFDAQLTPTGLFDAEFNNGGLFSPEFTTTASGAISAVINGTSTVTAALAGVGAVAAAINGASSVTAALTGTGALAAAINGDSSVTVDLEGFGALASVINGAATVTAALTGTGALASTIQGQAAVSAILAGTGALAATILGTGAVSVTIGEIVAIQAAIQGDSTVVGALEGNGALAANLDGISVVSATLVNGGGGAIESAIFGQAIVSATGATQRIFFPPSGTGASTQTLSSTGVSYTNPSTVSTSSNDLTPFFWGDPTSYMGVPAGPNLLPGFSPRRTYYMVNGGNVTIPLSGVNTAVNFVLTLRGIPGFAPFTRMPLSIRDQVIATLPVPQSVPVGITPWQVICKLRGHHKSNLRIDWSITIGDETFSGTSISAVNPFTVNGLQFSIGVQFSGTVTNPDVFEAQMFQCDVQQR